MVERRLQRVLRRGGLHRCEITRIEVAAGPAATYEVVLPAPPRATKVTDRTTVPTTR